MMNFNYLYFDTINLVSKYTTEIMYYIVKEVATQIISHNLFVV